MLLKDLQKEISDFETQNVEVVQGLFYNQKDTIENIYFYYNSKFMSGDIDAEGDKKYFYNVVRNPCKVTTKAIDFDTKHINIQTAAGGNPLVTWYFERDLKFWMKDQNFGKILNRIFEELPRFGSVVLKVINGKPHFVDLRNFALEQAADTLDKSAFILEKHFYVPDEFRKVGNELGWDNIEEAIEHHRKMEEPYIAVYERYGDVGTTDTKGKTTYAYKKVLFADVGVDSYDRATRQTVPYTGFLLKEDEVKKHPYWEFHIEKIPGRWLGVGIVETLFDVQIRMNELANQEAKSTYWNSLRLFQTSDEGINKNLMTEVKSGDTLNPDSPITPIDMTERNMAYFNMQTQKWFTNRDENTFAYDVIQGERLPAGTPLGSAKLAAGMAGSHFDQIQENVALDIKEFLFKVIIPQFEKENVKEHSLRLAGEDLDKLNQLIVNQKVTNDLFRFIERKSKLPTLDQYEVMKAVMEEKVKKGKERILTIPKEFYKNLKYKLDIIITGEQKDSAVYSQTLFAILQAITTDPTILTDPTKKKIFYKIAEAGGVDLSDIEPESTSGVEKLTEAQPQRGGGGVSRPSFSETPQAPSQKRI